MNKSDESQFIREASIRLLSAYLIEEPLSCIKAKETDSCISMNDLIEYSVDAAELLARELKQRGYMSKPKSVIVVDVQTTEGGDRND